MSQNNTGIRSILTIPVIYSFFGQLVGASRINTIFIKEYVQPKVNNKLLDMGCGTADILRYLPKNVKYTGLDASAHYIQMAQKRYGHRASFICDSVNTNTFEKSSHFDIVLAVGVLHHLEDREALQLFKMAHTALKKGGRLVTMDGVFVEKQSSIAKWLISKDRGQNVRTQAGYLELAHQAFSNVNTDIRHDLLRIPYTHLILECTKR